jgi:hypothetical protein
MRRKYIFALVLLVCPQTAHAQETSAAGWLGAGNFGDAAAATVDLGFDVQGNGASMGMGARLRWLAGDGFRNEDWDELSEFVGVLRYFTWTTEPGPSGEEVQGALAIGRLGGVGLGHGSVIDGFTTGLDVDHGQIGAQVRAQRGTVGAEAMIDDLVAPRIVGLRGHALLKNGLDVGLSFAGDATVPALSDGPMPMTGERALLFAGADAQYARARADGRADGRLYVDLVGVRPFAGGLHLGAAGTVALGDQGTRAGLRAEARAGTDGYVPGWIGPLYQRLRAEQLARAGAGGLAGLGGLGELTVEDPRVGAATLSVAQRAGLPWLAAARMAAPSYRGVQAAVWAAAELGSGGGTDAFALEARARLPGAMFAIFEAAHLFRGTEMGPEPIWIATAAVGGVLGE